MYFSLPELRFDRTFSGVASLLESDGFSCDSCDWISKSYDGLSDCWVVISCWRSRSLRNKSSPEWSSPLNVISSVWDLFELLRPISASLFSSVWLTASNSSLVPSDSLVNFSEAPCAQSGSSIWSELCLWSVPSSTAALKKCARGADVDLLTFGELSKLPEGPELKIKVLVSYIIAWDYYHNKFGVSDNRIIELILILSP